MKTKLINGRIYDGNGGKPFYGELAFADDTILAVGTKLDGEFHTVIDVGGKAICPGFIDTHSHSDLRILVDSAIPSKIRQGITTEVCGQDGVSMAPIPEEYSAKWRLSIAGLEGDDPSVNWVSSGAGEYMRRIEANKPIANYAYLCPHGNIRMEVMGIEARAATEEELCRIEQALRRELDAGAAGMSSGLIYIPCVYATTEEMIRLCRILKEYDRPFVVHQRMEFNDIMTSMQELADIKENIHVDATVLVVDAMTGQDAVNVASTFADKVGIDGVILTKMDGDTRGGAALSIKAVTGKPILYVGMGEKLSDLEQFYPERMASRILGMGDVMSLIEKAEASIDKEQAQDMQKKLKKMDFDFNDYLTSMEQMNKMGGIGSILNMLPGMGGKMKDIEGMIDEKAMDRTKSIILSMTPQERSNPSILNISRKNRIARGAGVDVTEVNRLVKQFEQSKKMMKQMPGLMGGKAGKRGGGFKLPFGL